MHWVGQPNRPAFKVVFGGPWELITTYSWAKNASGSWSNMYKAASGDYQWDYKPCYTWLLSPMSLQFGLGSVLGGGFINSRKSAIHLGLTLLYHDFVVYVYIIFVPGTFPFPVAEYRSYV